MNKKLSRRHFITQMSVVGAAAGGGLMLSETQASESSGVSTRGPNPDRQHVRRRGRGFKVLPNGVDDHDNLEWALRNTRRGGTVRLVAGTYKMGSTAVIADFDGKLVGAGTDKTTMTCTDSLNYEIWEAPGGGKDQGLPKPPPFPRVPIAGSLTKTAPGLILFYKTPLQAGEDPVDRANRIEIRDMFCRGAMIGSPWAFGDEVLCFTIINSMDWDSPSAEPQTTRQDVHISNMKVAGYKTDEFGVFGNACACITILGGAILTDNYDLDGPTDGDALGLSNGGLLGVTPAEGDVTLTNCDFSNCRLGPGVVGYKNGNLLFENVSTDGCRGNCLQFFDNSNCRMVVRDCDLFCNSFLLPPELTPGGMSTDIPSSLGCVVAIQGLGAGAGFPSNVRWLSLVADPAAHAAHPEAGPLGTWRPQGPRLAPEPSTLRIVDNSCLSSGTPNSYCLHVIDIANAAFGLQTVTARIRDNECNGSQTCVSLEHVNDSRVRRNECGSQKYGIELHNSFNTAIGGNDFSFQDGEAGCEVRTLALGEKLDFYRAVSGAGTCALQS